MSSSEKRKPYTSPQIEVILFDAQDVLTTSTVLDDDNAKEIPGEWIPDALKDW